jgi:hypothetical protein
VRPGPIKLRRLAVVCLGLVACAVALPGAVGASGGTPVSITFDAEFTGSWTSVGDTLRIDPGSWTGQPTAYASDWYRCDGAGGNCALIPGDHPFLYTVASDDLGKTLFAVVTASNNSGSASVSSYLSGVVGSPTIVSQPVITGDANVDGSTLSVTTGTWTGSPTSYAYQWSSCDATTLDCSAIPGATASTFHVSTSALNNNYLTVDVTASAASGSADNGLHPAFAVGRAHTDVISPGGAAGAPTAVVQPYWTGDASTVGNVLVGDTGAWRNHPSSLSYSWFRCPQPTCTLIPGTLGQTTYTVQPDDLGQDIVFSVNATNIAGSSGNFGFFGYLFNNTYSSQSGRAGAPEPKTVPTLTGDPENVGSLLQVTGVIWFAPQDTSITQTWEWIRCDAPRVNCVEVDESDVPDYEVTSDDLGHTIYVVVNATNSFGTTSVPSATTTPPIGSPINTDPPVISGDISAAGNKLSVSTGDWLNGTTSFDYQWYSCNTGGVDCNPISGATDTTYETTSDDLDTTLMVEVDATNAYGDGVGDSSHSDVIGSPYSVAAPVIGSTDQLSDGTPIAELGDTLSVGQGTWHGAPTGFQYAWFRCDPSSPSRSDFNNCVGIPGLFGSSYTTVTADLGHTIFVVVDASNSHGTTSATAFPLGSVGVPQPLLDDGSVSGTAQVGQTLTFVNGTSWAGDTPITWFYRWSRCDTVGANCVRISDATASTYTLVSADAGHVIQGLIGGSNVWGGNGWGLAYTSAVVTAAPSGGGGGGGGGGGMPLDLSVALSPSATQIAPGGSVLFHITVTDASKSPATHLHVLVEVPAGARVSAASTDRGPGCQPAATPGWLDCNLDYLSGSPVEGNVLVTLTFPNAGSETVTANVKADQAEGVLTNNTATVTVQVGTPPPPQPPTTPPPLKAPLLKQLNTRTLAGVVRGTTETVTGRFSANEPLRFRLTVTKQRRTKRILLHKSSYLAGATSKTSGYTLTRSVGRGGVYSFRAVFGRRGLTKGAIYIVHLTATNANGTTRTLTIPFRA